MALSKSEDVVHAQSVIPCSVCDDEEPGQRYCIECKQTLCTKCAKSHRKVASTKDHNIILRTQIGEIEVLNCIDHEEPASVHCEKCNIPVCIRCVTGNHQGHKMVQLDDIIEQKKQLLQKKIDKIKNDVLPELVRKKSQIASKRENYEKSFQNQIKGVEKEKDNVLRGLHQIYTDNLKSLHGTRQCQILVFEKSTREIDKNIQFCEKRISEYQDVITTKNFNTVMNFTFEHEPVQMDSGESELPMPPSFVPSNIEKIIKSVTKLSVNCPSQATSMLSHSSTVFVSSFKSPIKGSSSIAITDEGYVWIAGCDVRELKMVNMKGEILQQRKMQNRPNGIAVMKCGDLIISPQSPDNDRVRIKILSTDGREYRTTEHCSAFGVSVTPDQKILICYKGGKVVKTDQKGTNIKDVYVGSGFCSTYHVVESEDGKTYISDRKNSRVVVIDKEGSVVSTFDKTSSGEKLGKPVGLVLNKEGNILFADKDNDCVYIIDKDQQIRELVGRSHGIRKPRYLAIDGSGHLWITSFNETIIIVKFVEENC